jgi:hypothetical protein
MPAMDDMELRRGLLAASRTRLSPLIGELKLDGPTTEKLVGIGADWGLRNLEAAAAFTEGKLAAEAAVRTEVDTERETTNQIRSLLGAAEFLTPAQTETLKGLVALNLEQWQQQRAQRCKALDSLSLQTCCDQVKSPRFIPFRRFFSSRNLRARRGQRGRKLQIVEPTRFQG